MNLVTVLTYWVIVVIWLTVLATVFVLYWRNPRAFGTSRLLLGVLAIEALRNVAESSYFGLYFTDAARFLPARLAGTLTPAFQYNLFNIISGCLVLSILLLRWLPQALQEWRQSLRLAEEQRQRETHDKLTGLFNLRHFLVLMQIEWERARRYDRPLSLLIFNIDPLEPAVGRRGRRVEDPVLMELAEACRECTRSSDTIGRIDREKFAVLLPETRGDDARLFAERLRQAVMGLHLPDAPMTVSIGIAEAAWDGNHRMLLAQAELALSTARQSAGNRICVFNPAAAWTTEPIN